MIIEVTSQVLGSLKSEARNAHPHECCGLLIGDGATITSVVPAHNVHPAPQTHFEIDPQTLINAHREARSGGPQIIGYYHSHPNGQPQPSATDRQGAAGDGSIWCIIANDECTFWHDGKEAFIPLSYTQVLS